MADNEQELLKQRLSAVISSPLPTEDQLKGRPTILPLSLDQILNSPPPSDAQLSAAGFRGMDDHPVDQLSEPSDTPSQIEVSKTGRTIAPVPGWSQTLDAIQRGFIIGGGGFAQAGAGWEAAFGKNFADVEKDVATKQLLKAQQDSEDYANQHAWYDFNRLMEFGAGLVPGGAAMLGAGLATGTAAFVLGAPVTVPTLFGMAGMGAILGFGQGVYNSMKHGADRIPAVASGLGQAAVAYGLTFVGGGAAKEIPLEAAKQLVAKGTKQTVLKAVTHISKQAGIAVSVPTLQTFVDSLMDNAAAVVSKNGKPMPFSEVLKHTGNTMVASAQAFPFLAGGGAVAGAVSGRVVKAVAERVKTHEEAVKALAEAVKRQTEAILKEQLKEESKIPPLEKQAEVTGKEAEAAREKANELTADAKKAAIKAIRAEIDRRKQEARLYAAMLAQQAERKNLQLNPTKAGVKRVEQATKNYARQEGKAVEQRKKATDARLFFADAANKAELARQAAEQAKLIAEQAKENLAAQKAKVEAIPNVNLPLSDREVIIRAGLAAGVMPKAAPKVLQKLAKTGDYEAAAKAAFNNTPVSKLKGEEGRLRRWEIWKDTAGLNLRGLLAYIFQHAPPEVQQELIKALDITEAATEAAVKRMTYTQRLQELIEQATGLTSEEVNKLMHEAATTEINGTWSDGRPIAAPDEHGVMRKFTVADAMSYMKWAKNKDAQAALYSPEGNNFPSDFADTLQKHIEALPNGDKFIKALEGLDNFYKETGPILKDVHDRHTGGNLPLQDNYGGPIKRLGSVPEPLNGLAPSLPGRGSVVTGKSPVKAKFSATIRRGAVEQPIVAQGAFTNAVKYAAGLANYEANIGRYKLWDGFVNDPVVEQNITEKWGKDVLDMLRNRYLDHVHGVPAVQRAQVEWIDSVMRANRISVLGANPLYTLQHWFTLSNFFLARYNGKLLGDALLPGMVEAILNPRKAAKEVLSWDAVKERYNNPNTIGGIVSGNQSPKDAKAERNAMIWFERGDKPSVVIGAYAVRKAVQGITGDYEEAKRVATKVIEDVLPSGRSNKWTELTTNPTLKPFTQFAQPDLQLRQLSFEAGLLQKNFPSPENLANQIRTEIIARTASTLFLTPKLAVSLAEAAWTGNPDALARTSIRIASKITLGNMLPGVESLGEVGLSTLTGVSPMEADLETAVGRGFVGAGKLLGHDVPNVFSGDLSIHSILQSVIHAYQAATLLGKGKPVAPLIWLDKLFGGK